jgi:hypothetical protein
MIDMSHPLVLPRVNMNGTSKGELVSQLTDVTRALDEAVSLMAIARPHGRDFQTFSDGEERCRQARDAWDARMKVVLKIQAQILAHAIEIHGQG